jgi:DNA-binding PadR family transcriptional regulator
MHDRDLYSGLIRLHVLHHAAEEPIFGLGMVEELARHGYRISPGTLYPLLHGLEKKGYLRSTAAAQRQVACARSIAPRRWAGAHSVPPRARCVNYSAS